MELDKSLKANINQRMRNLFGYARDFTKDYDFTPVPEILEEMQAALDTLKAEELNSHFNNICREIEALKAQAKDTEININSHLIEKARLLKLLPK
jgi:uncharacterized membrane-anchored protein YhcB (DUF1043 family)